MTASVRDELLSDGLGGTLPMGAPFFLHTCGHPSQSPADTVGLLHGICSFLHSCGLSAGRKKFKASGLLSSGPVFISISRWVLG